MRDICRTIWGWGVKQEQALSEVIGFLMIVSLLAILFSMYLLYVVPIQGRDAEISHMKYITQEFIDLKADIDGLIINDKINMPISRSFELGTLSSVGKGSFSIMPMSSFIEAAGTLMVNEQNDHLTINVVGDFVDYSDIESDIDSIRNINPSAPNEKLDETLRFRDFLLNKGVQKILFWELDDGVGGVLRPEDTVIDLDGDDVPDLSPNEVVKLDNDDDYDPDDNDPPPGGVDDTNPARDASYCMGYYFGDRLYLLKTEVRPQLIELGEYDPAFNAFDENLGYQAEINDNEYLIPRYRYQKWDFPIDLIIEGYAVTKVLDPNPNSFPTFDDFLDAQGDDYLTEAFRDSSRPGDPADAIADLSDYIDFDNPVYKKTIIKDVQPTAQNPPAPPPPIDGYYNYYTVNIFDNNEIVPESLEDYVKIHPEWLNKIRDTLIRMEYEKYNPDVTANPEDPIMITTYLDPDVVIDGVSINPDMLPPRIGSLQYWSQNRYWVNQELLYEMGGLFLKQSDGVSIMLVPSISVSEVIPYNSPDPLTPLLPSLKITMTNIRITDTEDVSGSLSAQVFSKVDNIAQNLIYGTNIPLGSSPDDLDDGVDIDLPMDWKLREGTENAQFLWIKYTPEIDLNNDRQIASVNLWKRGFDQIYTIASKSMANAEIVPADYIDVVTILDGDAVDLKRRYSANFFIAHNFNPFAECGGDGVCTLDELEQSVDSYLRDPDTGELIPHQEFILDYKEAEVSLVMQSGAL